MADKNQLRYEAEQELLAAIRDLCTGLINLNTAHEKADIPTLYARTSTTIETVIGKLEAANAKVKEVHHLVMTED